MPDRRRERTLLESPLGTLASNPSFAKSHEVGSIRPLSLVTGPRSPQLLSGRADFDPGPSDPRIPALAAALLPVTLATHCLRSPDAPTAIRVFAPLSSSLGSAGVREPEGEMGVLREGSEGARRGGQHPPSPSLTRSLPPQPEGSGLPPRD